MIIRTVGSVFNPLFQFSERSTAVNADTGPASETGNSVAEH